MNTKVLLPADFPRIVAHRGFSRACPENTLPAFGAAVAMDADEVELDVWPSLDGELVILHDPKLDRTTDGTGIITEMRWQDIAAVDAGIKHGDQWRGVRVPRLQDVWNAIAGQVVFNIHIKDAGEDGFVIRKIKRLAGEYGILGQIYIAGNNNIMEAMLQYAPEIGRCCLNGSNGWNLVDKAVEYRCDRIQFANKYCDIEQIEKAHKYGIICNLFYADDPKEAEKYYEWGIDSILTNALSEILPVTAAARAKSTFTK